MGGREVGEQRSDALVPVPYLPPSVVDLWSCSQIYDTLRLVTGGSTMPLFSLDIQKSLRGEFWTNRYILNADTLLAATPDAVLIVEAERAITIADVQFVSYRISDQIKGTDQYIVVPIGTFGLRVTSTQALPLFDVLRVDFGVGLGRPSRKYLRGVLSEQDQTNYGELDLAAVTYFTNNYATPVKDVAGYVDVDGQDITSGRVYGQVGMRQLRRGSKRKEKPVIPVS